MEETFGEVISLLSSEANVIRSILSTPCCSTPYSGRPEIGYGYFNLSKYLAKLDKAIEILSVNRVDIKQEEGIK